MRIFKVLFLSFVLMAVVACSDEETNIEKHYEGGWVLKTNTAQMDSVSDIFISAEGNFSYILNYGTADHRVKGSVGNSGMLEGDVTLDTLLLGSINGTFYTNGTGKGEYNIVNRKISWTATKK